MSERRVILGEAEGRKITLDLEVLLRTKLLVQANSGGGKSWLLRRLAEQLFGRLPILLIDPEGEFATLRERYGYVLVGQGGETPADVRSAGLVAQRLLELRASAVCDLYEMKAAHRHEWVRRFLEALIDAPKKLWQPLLVIVDEAHLFIPEKGSGESEAADAMTGLSTRGRKRGFCPIWATQRLAKVRKDAAAELQNRLIGPTFMDVDRERAADDLGVAKTDRRAFFDQIKLLPEGHFFGLGRAIALERVLIRIGSVRTSHPEPGSAKHAAAAPPPPEKVRALLPKLADLPAEAETRERTLAELKADNAVLRQELRARRAAPTSPAAKVKPVEIEVIKPATVKAVGRAIDRTDAAIARAGNLEVRLREAMQAAGERGGELRQVRDDLVGQLRALRIGPAPSTMSPRMALVRSHQKGSTPAQILAHPTAIMASRDADHGRDAKGTRRVFAAIAVYADGVTRDQLSILAGYKRSTRDAYVQRLRAAGHVEVRGDRILATQTGQIALGPVEPLPTGGELRAYWLARLGAGERAVLSALLDAYPKALDRDVLSELTGYKRSTRDAYLQRLVSRRVAVAVSRGEVRAAEEFFL